MLCCSDIELNPGPEMCYEYFFKVSEKYKTTYAYCFFHLNFQDVTKKQRQLKSFINDMGQNAIIRISSCWLTPDDKMSSWNVALKIHKLLRCDRSSTICKKKDGGVMLFVPLKLSPSERDDLKIFDNSTFEWFWVECRCKFWKKLQVSILLKKHTIP